jgi:cell division septum initiation protein DivIVA
MNEDRVRQVLEIERRAAATYDAAVQRAERIPSDAEKEAAAESERILAAARAEADRLVEAALAQEEAAQILARAEEEARRLNAAARKNMERAVGFIVDSVAGESAP